MNDQNLGDPGLQVFYKWLNNFKSRFGKDMFIEDVAEITGLNEREIHILLLRYESGTKLRMTLENVANHFSIGRERVRQIICKALRKLRQPRRQEELKEFLNEKEAKMTKEEAIRELARKLSEPEKKTDFAKYHNEPTREAILELSDDKDSIIAKAELVNMICKAIDSTIQGSGCWDILFSIKHNGPFDASDEAHKRRQDAYDEQQKIRKAFKDGVAEIEAEYSDKENSEVH
jgi:hypothetical protein